jgi:CHRD domain
MNQLRHAPAGKWYVNLHTAANPNGEVRGQVTKGM